jgi:hypothetical protein
MRREAGSGLRAVATLAATSTTDIVPAALAYLYCVQTLDGNGNASPCSVGDVATTLTLSAINANSTTVAAAHYQQVFDAVNGIYDIYGGSHVTWAGICPGVPAPASGGTVYAQHVTALRNAITTARSQLVQATQVQLPAVSFTDNPLSSGASIRAVHMQDLQGGVR